MAVLSGGGVRGSPGALRPSRSIVKGGTVLRLGSLRQLVSLTSVGSGALGAPGLAESAAPSGSGVCGHLWAAANLEYR